MAPGTIVEHHRELDMAERDGDRPGRRGPRAAKTSRSALDKELRALYAQYGRGDVPETVIDLIHRLEAAHREAVASEPAKKRASKAPARPHSRPKTDPGNRR